MKHLGARAASVSTVTKPKREVKCSNNRFTPNVFMTACYGLIFIGCLQLEKFGEPFVCILYSKFTSSFSSPLVSSLIDKILIAA